LFQDFKIKTLALVFGVFEIYKQFNLHSPQKSLFPNSYEIRVEIEIDKKGLVNSKFDMEKVITYIWKI
jgi:hypothetical protein